ncbi:branched-chain amino acid ABC transporter permease/ATP-binding protein [Rhodococcus opacus]|uniref:branched-chain amino acid ABC transporter permease/ATP-binding protein n=1 Tax=Rhodococcus opacus TaxID=37919 RepID=UPI001C476E0B|nr:branched-chain amino acid ABC transporter permease/ATP-binding protein [Rhodococcus opacus]MBV6761600.1 ATP-binding cassette domain-containing protein [Rhodococcus opacus]
MSSLLPFVIAGLTLGAVYGLAGVGLVLTYKTSGVFNFAHGALATVAAYSFYSLHITMKLPWQMAAAIAIFVIGPLLGLAMELLARRIQATSLPLQVAATVGVLLAIGASAQLIYGTDQLLIVRKFLGTGTFELGDTTVLTADVITCAVALLATVALSVYFKFTRRGIAMRAVVDNPDLLDVVGTSPSMTRRIAWVIGGVFTAVSGVLFAPLLPLDAVQLTFLVVSAFGAAALGAFSNLWVTFLGGLAIGVLASLSTKWFTDGILAGIPAALPFLVLFVVLLVFPKRALSVPAFTVPRPRPVWAAPMRMHVVAGIVLVLVLAAVPTFAGVYLTAWTTTLALVIVFLSLVLLVRTAGQVSLSHVAFMAIGAVAFSRIGLDSGLPWIVSLILAGLVAVPVGAILAIPASRLGGLYLALATFGFAVLLQEMFYSQRFMFGASVTSLNVPRPGIDWFQSDSGYYYVVLALVVVTAIAVMALNIGRLGKLLRAMSDSPTALATSGASVNVTRVLVFCLSAFLAGVGGALVGAAQTSISAISYPPMLSLTYFVLIMIAAGGMPWSAVMAAVGMTLIPAYVHGETVNIVFQLLFGVFAVIAAMQPGSAGGAPVAVQRVVDRIFGSKGKHTEKAKAAVVPVERERVSGGELKVEDLRVQFGGIVAVDGLGFSAPTGTITGLIGPNGAGKTTTFNACSGLNQPARGRVLLNGKDVSRLGPAARARLGLGRTFQRMQLLDSLTVRENVAIGLEAALAGANPIKHILPKRGEHAIVDARTEEALALCELAELADTPAASLSTGQRRLVELARCLVGDFRILLLDEPSSGLDRAETERFGEILRRVVDERGVGILLVEHDMALVLDVCENIHVLDFGKHIFSGTAREAMQSPIVQSAYLGEDHDFDQAVADELDDMAVKLPEGVPAS